MIRAIIFDFGRVISAQKPASLFRSYEEELGLTPGLLNRTMFGSDGWQETLIGRKTSDEYWGEIGPLLNLHTQEEIAAFRSRYAADEAINEGVRDLIHTLRGSYKLAVLSNAPAGLSRWLAEWEILDLFDVVVCSGEVGVAKPDPAIYELTLARLGVAPGEAVFIDDSLGHVTAAGQLGIQGIHFSTVDALLVDLNELLY